MSFEYIWWTMLMAWIYNSSPQFVVHFQESKSQSWKCVRLEDKNENPHFLLGNPNCNWKWMKLEYDILYRWY